MEALTLSAFYGPKLFKIFWKHTKERKCSLFIEFGQGLYPEKSLALTEKQRGKARQ